MFENKNNLKIENQNNKNNIFEKENNQYNQWNSTLDNIH